MTEVHSGSAAAAILVGPGDFRMTDLSLPAVAADDGLLRPELVGICGTDCKIASGAIPVPYPIILGHELVGVIAEAGTSMAERIGVSVGDRVVVETSVPCWSCRQCWTGDYRFCERRRAYGINTPIKQSPGLWGGLAEAMYLAPGSIVHLVPTAMTARRALVATLLANGIEWVQNLGGLRVGDSVVVQGCGPQGLAAVAVARLAGAGRVVVTGLGQDAGRLALARRLGADEALVAEEHDMRGRVLELTDGAGADVVLDVTGVAESPVLSASLVRTRGTLVLAGLSGGRSTTLQLDDVVNREVRVQGAFVKGDQAFRAALILADRLGPVHPVDDIVSHVFPLDQADKAIAAACGDRAADFIKAAVAI